MVPCKKSDYLRYMTDVQQCDARMTALNEQWENIKLLCEINCSVQSQNILPSIVSIQDGFFELQGKLTDTLIRETRNKLERKILPKAQVAVDILIRNLYERTADVGFLAADDDIREFVCRYPDSEEHRRSILTRLQEYVAKYSVYEEIVVLNRDGVVLANLDENNPILGRTIEDPLVIRAMESSEGFLEFFRPSPLQAAKRNAHIFARRIYGEREGEVIGVICLCFRFENEMERIFKMLSTDYDGSVLMIVDGDNRVISSSDENQVPLGICTEPVEEGQDGVVYYRGMEYIVRTVSTGGYQGYFGLGWRGQVMIPLRLAFQERADLTGVDPELVRPLIQKADSFSSDLREIIDRTHFINRSLRRIIYNGQLLSAESGAGDEFYRLKAILSAIGAIGSRTSARFRQSAQDLFATVISASMVDLGFRASLCVDIMDRNLYERANDCRWWALNSAFRAILAKEEVGREDQRKLTEILTYINSLYTVYSNLFLFDRTGKIVAVSNPERTCDLGKRPGGGYLQNILRNGQAERYFVSPFESTELYGGRPAYIYGASITKPGTAGHTVGGIGIVFDSEFQLAAMLQEVLDEKANTFAVFTDRAGKVISSTDPKIRVGEEWQLPRRFFETPNGTCRREILINEGAYYAVGCACSSSYREYKSSDGYRNDVLAFFVEKLADCGDEEETRNIAAEANYNIPLTAGEKTVRLAAFAVGDEIFALEQSCVLETLEPDQIVRLPDTTETVRGAVQYGGQYIAVIHTHAQFFHHPEHPLCPYLLIVRAGENTVALEADELIGVLEVGESRIQPAPKLDRVASGMSGIVALTDTGRKRFALLINHEQLLKDPGYGAVNLDWDQIHQYEQENPAQSE